LTGGLDTSMLA